MARFHTVPRSFSLHPFLHTDMALLAQLQFGDNAVHLYTKTYNIVDCRCHFCRTYNHSRPESDARCERIELTVVAPAMTDPLLYEWYINQGEQNCRLAFFFSATDGNLEVEREMLLENAVCFGIEEDYSIDHQSRRLLKLQIMAEEVSHNP